MCNICAIKKSLGGQKTFNIKLFVAEPINTSLSITPQLNFDRGIITTQEYDWERHLENPNLGGTFSFIIKHEDNIVAEKHYDTESIEKEFETCGIYDCHMQAMYIYRAEFERELGIDLSPYILR